jgi:hypothetical protein
MMKAGFFEDHYSPAAVKISKVQFDDNFLTITGTSNYDEKKYGSYGDVIYTHKKSFSYTIDMAKLVDNVTSILHTIETTTDAIKGYKAVERYGYKHGNWELLENDVSNLYTKSTYPIKIVGNSEPDI